MLTVWCAVTICCENNDNPEPERKYLLRHEKVFEVAATALKDLIKSTPFLSSLSTEISFDVTGYRVEYTSSYQNKPITLSGVVMLPRSNSPMTMFSMQHGTITKNNKAPSEAISKNLTNFYGEVFIAKVLASKGFIMLLPDYIGFGVSSNMPHPYFIEDATTLAVTDMIRAGRELAIDKGMKDNGKLILAGHSEGGYATMATHKYLEEHPVNNITLTASFPSAGAYDLKKMQEYLWAQKEYDHPSFLAYIVHSYYVAFNLTLPLDNILQKIYADKIPYLFDGTRSVVDIDSELTKTVADLITPNIQQHIDTNPQYEPLINRLKENSLTKWIPTAKMYMYHGKKDATVPYTTSEATYNSLISHGASPNVVKLIATDGDHGVTHLFPYAVEMLTTIRSLQ